MSYLWITITEILAGYGLVWVLIRIAALAFNAPADLLYKLFS